jgi:hypothetical protein
MGACQGRACDISQKRAIKHAKFVRAEMLTDIHLPNAPIHYKSIITLVQFPMSASLRAAAIPVVAISLNLATFGTRAKYHLPNNDST